VETELSRRPREMAVGFVENPADEPPLELAASILEGNAAGHHLIDQPYKELSHQRLRGGLIQRSALPYAAYTESWVPVRRSNASMYFARVRETTSSGSAGAGGCLFHVIASR
jgi:hypothetical protein